MKLFLVIEPVGAPFFLLISDSDCPQMVWFGEEGDFLGSIPQRDQLGRTSIISLCLRDPVAEEVELSPWALPNHNCFFLSVIRYIDLLFKIITELVNMVSGCKTKGMLLQKLHSNYISMTISLSFCIFYVSSFVFSHPPFSAALSSVQDSQVLCSPVFVEKLWLRDGPYSKF